MPLNIGNAQNAGLAGTMRFRKWQQNFMDEWVAPIRKLAEAKEADQAVIAWEKMPQQVKNELRERYPEQYAAAEEKVRALKVKRS